MVERSTAYLVSIEELIQASGKVVEQQGVVSLVIRGNSVSRVNVVGTITQLELSTSQAPSRMTLDDGTGSISVLSFQQPSDFHRFAPSDPVLVIGRIRQYQQQLYLIAEIIKKLSSPIWFLVRKKQLALLQQDASQETTSLASSMPGFSSGNAFVGTTASSVPLQAVTQELFSSADELQPLPYHTPSSGMHPHSFMDQEEDLSVNPSIFGLQEVILKTVNFLDKGMGAPLEQVLAMVNHPDAERLITLMLKEGDLYTNKPGYLKVL
ncbi:MAG: hypothetical protein QW594_04365 [Candidatus Woesearchaeota archaeon]